MCGIVGYHGKGDATKIVLNGLKKLEYRGYDSWGISVMNGGGILLEKHAGQIGNAETKLPVSSLAIGHTRWATHGGVTMENAHPHLCCNGEVSVVHNGIIENFQEIRNALKQHTFSSQTDTEVIPHLIEEQLANSNIPIEQAISAALKKITGSYALLVISSREPGKIVAVRKESPLVIGIANDGTFVASDALPFLSYTNKVIELDDCEMAVITGQNVEYYNIGSMQRLDKHPTAIKWSAEEVGKGTNEHYMIKEIFEQPTALRNSIVQDKKQLEAFANAVINAKNLKLVACGTSRHAAIIGRYVFNKLAGKPADVYIASEFSYFADSCDRDTVILAVSQSGETADVLDGLRKAKAKGAKILSIVNVIGSSIARLSDIALYINCGPEIGVASTKAFLNQLAIFYLVGYTMAGECDIGIQHIKNAAALVEETIKINNDQMKSLAHSIKNIEHMYFIARGVNFPMATEGALKLKEISYIHAEGMPAGELKHGTLALIEEGTRVILINPLDYTYADSLGNGMETKARGAFLIGISNKNNPAYDHFIQLPTPTDELTYPFISIVPLQLLAYYTAVEKGLNPDKPRNLAKSVTVK